MFKKVLIANRGAIACRIIRTLKQMNITAVSVYAEADADSLHVTDADESWSLGEGAATQTYLDQDKLLQVAAQAKVDAVHPGYGFLSENPEFLSRCEQAGLVFLGPTAEQMEMFGLKHRARALAMASDVPLLPGSDLLSSVDDAIREANMIGYPVMLKSTAGGGGIGMQRCDDEDDLRAAYESVKRLGENNFSNGGLFVEKFIASARHIEVQLFGDGLGQVVALGERDCSAQRRNQKVLEETPAPGLTDTVRQALQQTAIRLGQQVNYRSAGTVEFVYDQQTEQFYFLEMNTRLQVEHGVTEQVFGIDLVRWMVELGQGTLVDLPSLAAGCVPQGHAIQVRLYAEDPAKQFQPCAGLLSAVAFPEADGKACRIDHWLESGIQVSPYFDPMLAKVIVWADDREQALAKLTATLTHITLYGIETNLRYLQALIASPLVASAQMLTRSLNSFAYYPDSLEVISGGTQTTIQDVPGRQGYWDVGVPPSGPMDNLSFRLGNRLLGNAAASAGLEITLAGPTIKFNRQATVVLTGAEINAHIDGQPLPMWQVTTIDAGSTLVLGRVQQGGARSYLLFAGGIDCPLYLGSRATFTLGQFGGHAGRALQAGDVLRLNETSGVPRLIRLPDALQPEITNHWQLRVIYGPHGAPDFFTEQDITTFFSTDYEVHYNSNRTGVRLIGPHPQWAREDGGEAGLHPSNIHDNAYAVGTVDFTGDMPVILGPDGPSLGGFVCPATIIKADLWKMGQLKAGDRVRFVPVSLDDAEYIERAQLEAIEMLTPAVPITVAEPELTSAILHTLPAEHYGDRVVYRPSGEDFLLVEYGDQILDIRLRFRVHALMLWLQQQQVAGILELTPGIRSLQIHFDNLRLARSSLLTLLQQAESELTDIEQLEVPARIVHLPLSWDDAATQLAIRKYHELVRKNAPWCPSNIEFIRRINGLDSIDDVKDIVFNARYLVMGLGDVYLGAPVATPLDPRHRLVTTKYNPARTWTPENAVGIGGAYLCVYGMEGPGGYQFVGRTLQMWNRYHQTAEFSQPWLLRFFDQLRFYEVSAAELQQIRRDFPRGRYPLKIEETSFSLADYNAFIAENSSTIGCFKQHQQAAFEAERQRWIANGQAHFEVANDHYEATAHAQLTEQQQAIESPVSGSVWQILVSEGDSVTAGQPLLILESMKMEISVVASQSGTVSSLLAEPGHAVRAGDWLAIVEENRAVDK